jgi:hypothetical protein
MARLAARVLRNSFVATLAAAIAAIFLEQAWWIRGIEGALFGFVAFASLPAAYQWAQKRSDVITLHFECAVDFLATKLPPEGRVTVVQLSPGGVPDQPSSPGPFRTHGLRFIPKTWVTLLVRRDLQGVRACKSRRRSIRDHNP